MADEKWSEINHPAPPPHEDPKLWLKTNGVAELLNDFATALLRARPSNILVFMALWAGQQQRQQTDANGSAATGGHESQWTQTDDSEKVTTS